MAPKRKYKIAIFVFICLFLGVPLLLAVLAFESEPVVAEVDMPAVGKAVHARKLAKRVFELLKKREAAELTVSHEEINSVFAFAHRAMQRVTGVARVSPEEVEGRASLYMPGNPLGNYLNIRFTIAPSEEGLDVRYVRLGRIYIPGIVAVKLGQWTLDLVSGERIGSLALDVIKGVSIDQSKVVTVHLNPIPDLDHGVDRMKERFAFVRDSVSLLGDPTTVRIYYEEIVKTDKALPKLGKQSLAKYMTPVFQIACERAKDPVAENQAAILALSIFFGSGKVERFVGDVRTGELATYKRKNMGTLAKRWDLTRHFLISATLHAMSDSEMSHALGEFKELMDAREGGSGFSFADLAADRAGVRFAEVAMGSREEAIRLMEQMAQNPGESAFFPDVSQLPEWLNQQAFESHFKDVNSTEYVSLVEAIDQCISRLPAYNAAIDAGQSNCDLVSVLPPRLELGSQAAETKN